MKVGLMETYSKDFNPEEYMKDAGVVRFRTAKARAEEKGRQSLVGGNRRLADVTIAKCTEEIGDYVRRAHTAARKSRSRQLPQRITDIRAVGVSTAAYIAVRTVFDGLGEGHKLVSLSIRLGARLEDEMRFREYKKQSPLEFGRTKRDVGQAGSYRYKRQTMLRRSVRDEAVEGWESWTYARKLKVGSALVTLICDATGLFGYKRETVGRRRTPYFVYPTEKCLALIERGDAFEELMRPWFLPTLTIPLKWTTPWDGGYATFEMPLVKRATKAFYERLEKTDMPAVYRTVNALQETAWCVNTDVLETYQACVKGNVWVKGMAAPEKQEMPVLLDWMVPMEKMSEAAKDDFRSTLSVWQVEEKKAWNQVAGRVHEFNRRRKSHTIAIEKVGTVAEMLRSEPCFYMPYQLDWRGRVYPVPLFLNPQGCDLSRGLLMFAESKAFGTQAAVDWWKVEGSNRFGNDKVPFAERIDWVQEHHSQILAVGDSPETELWWTDADKPFQFLAWCLEYAAWCELGSSLEFHSSCVVSMDGSCNGLQHLSALMLDEEGAEATNLLPSDIPQDIYARVCQKVVLAVERDNTNMARQWLQSGLLTRSVVKRQVMTTPYGATSRGMTLQLGKYMREVADASGNHTVPFEGNNAWDAIMYLAPTIKTAIEDTVKGAATCMKWLMSCAKVVADHSLPVRWTVATGFPVEQFYPALRTRRVEAILYGPRRALLSVKVPKGMGKADRKKMIQSISPNYIHSLDAAHLQLTVAAMEFQHGAHSWCMVHDSFGTHAADAGRMAVTLREEFVRMYDGCDAMEDFRNNIEADSGLEMPDAPPQGNLDLNEVRKALFFFA